MDVLSVASTATGIAIFVSWVALLVAALVVLLMIRGGVFQGRGLGGMEISEAELGIGQSKVTLRPNHSDVQIAYKLWVEVSTRKIGLPIDLEHDVIAEIYDSWYQFFQVTRELIKDIPARKIRGSESTEKLVDVAVDVLNKGLRPHLTTWQARFRRWYERELQHDRSAELAPQDLQKAFPKYQELTTDLLTVNQGLIQYRSILRTIAMGPYGSADPPAVTDDSESSSTSDTPG